MKYVDFTTKDRAKFDAELARRGIPGACRVVPVSNGTLWQDRATGTARALWVMNREGTLSPHGVIYT